MRLAKSTPARPKTPHRSRQNAAGSTLWSAAERLGEACACSGQIAVGKRAVQKQGGEPGDDGGVSDLLARLERGALGFLFWGSGVSVFACSERSVLAGGLVRLRRGFPVRVRFGVRHGHSPLDCVKRFCALRGGVPASRAPRMPAREFPAPRTLRAPPAASSRAPHSACPRPARPRPMPDETASSPSIIETTARPAPRNTEWRVVAKRIRSAGVPPSNHTLRSPSFGVLERKVGAVPNFVASEGSACPIPDDGRTGSRLVGRVAHTGAKRGRFRERKRRREEPRGEKHG